MAPPTKVPPRVVFKEIYVSPYRFVQIHVGAITESEVFFAAYNTDGKTNYVCPYGFFEKLPNAARGKLDDVLTGAKVNHSVSVIGFGGTVLKYDPVSPIALNELTGSAATLTTRNVAIAAQRGDKFLV